MGDTGAISLGITIGIIAMLTNTALLLPIIGFVFWPRQSLLLFKYSQKKYATRRYFFQRLYTITFKLLVGRNQKLLCVFGLFRLSLLLLV